MCCGDHLGVVWRWLIKINCTSPITWKSSLNWDWSWKQQLNVHLPIRYNRGNRKEIINILCFIDISTESCFNILILKCWVEIRKKFIDSILSWKRSWNFNCSADLFCIILHCVSSVMLRKFLLHNNLQKKSWNNYLYIWCCAPSSAWLCANLLTREMMCLCWWVQLKISLSALGHALVGSFTHTNSQMKAQN